MPRKILHEGRRMSFRVLYKFTNVKGHYTGVSQCDVIGVFLWRGQKATLYWSSVNISYQSGPDTSTIDNKLSSSSWMFHCDVDLGILFPLICFTKISHIPAWLQRTETCDPLNGAHLYSYSSCWPEWKYKSPILAPYRLSAINQNTSNTVIVITPDSTNIFASNHGSQ